MGGRRRRTPKSTIACCATKSCPASTTSRATAARGGGGGRLGEGTSGESRRPAGTGEEPILLVKKVDHPSRIHLDIETDDQEAEVKRLEALGARRVGRVKTWWVLEAPTGQRFCVINPQRGS